MQTITISIHVSAENAVYTREYYYQIAKGTIISKQSLLEHIKKAIVNKKKNFNQYDDYDDSWLDGDLACLDTLEKAGWPGSFHVGHHRSTYFPFNLEFPVQKGSLKISACELEEW